MIIDERDMKIILNGSTTADIMSFVPEGYAIMGVIDEWNGYTFYINRVTHHIIAVRDSKMRSEVLSEESIGSHKVKVYTPKQEATLNMIQFRKDYNKVKGLTKTTHERYILEIFRGMIIENAIRSEVESKRKQIQDEYKKEG